MSELPHGWVKARIGDLCQLINGRAFKPHEWSDSGLPIIRIQNLNNLNAKFNYFNGELAEQHCVQNGDLLFAWSGTPGTSFGAHIWNGATAALNQHIFKVNFSDDHIERGYFQYAINQKLDELIGAAQGGVGLRHVTKGTFENTEIAFPPRAEQTLIAQNLASLFSRIEILGQRTKSMPKLLKQLRQSILSDAASGRLTESWRKNNNIYENRNTTNLESLCTTSFDGPFGSKLKSSDYTEDGVRVVRLENIGHLKFFNEKKTYISIEKSKVLAKNTLEEGDILFSSFVDEEIRVCQLPKSRERYINKADCFCLRIDPSVANPSFVTLLLAERSTYLSIIKSVHGTTRPRVNLGTLKKLELQIPSIEEQSFIVQKTTELFSFVDLIQKRCFSAESSIQKITKSILVKAFNGEFTADWRQNNQDLVTRENSAEVLLERIRGSFAVKQSVKTKRVDKKNSQSGMRLKKMMPIIDALKQADGPLTGQELLAQAGYPSDASIELIERFFLDIREQLNALTIKKTQKTDSDQDWFSLSSTKG